MRIIWSEDGRKGANVMGIFRKTLKKLLRRRSTLPQGITQQQEDEKKDSLHKSLQENLQEIRETVGYSPDVIVREFRIGEGGNIHAAIAYTEGLADTKLIHELLEELMLHVRETALEAELALRKNLLQLLKDVAIPLGDMKDVKDFPSLYNHLLAGETILLLDGFDRAVALSTRGWQDRGVNEPSAQTVIRGPKESFTETLRTNTSLIRRRIKDPRLWLETFSIGRVTKTEVAIMYIKGIAKDEIVAEVRKRLKRIDIDGILESGYIEELIQDETFTPFPTIHNTERPDAIAAGLLEGRVAILVEGTPFVLLVPALFTMFFHASEDYYQRSDIGNLLRMLRYLAFFISLLGPSLYIAITTFHQEMLPTQLLISLAAQREGIPFPAFIEALMMEVAFEILREAGVRMPRAVGQAVSIVGAIVIGQAAVNAGIVSAAMVIVVALTGIASFVSPTFNMAISARIIRFGFMALAASFGMYGITIGLIAMVLHLCSLRSFGVPYMAPMGPFIPVDQKDSILRFPWWALRTRPRLISQKNSKREDSPRPKPPSPPATRKKNEP
ncbi:spore germination protein GerKA [Bacillaceae bacterium]